jgi:hypothetical protein
MSLTKTAAVLSALKSNRKPATRPSHSEETLGSGWVGTSRKPRKGWEPRKGGALANVSAKRCSGCESPLFTPICRFCN